MFSFFCCLRPKQHNEHVEISITDNNSVEKTPRTDILMKNPLDNTSNDDKIINDN